jgi:hypothetical protein
MRHAQAVELRRQSEYHVKILYGKYILFPGKDPLVALCGLALGAMPVAAGVVTDAHGCARRTRIHMSAQGSRAAPGKGIQVNIVDNSTNPYMVARGAHGRALTIRNAMLAIQ